MSQGVNFIVAERCGRIVSTGHAPADQIPFQAMPGMIARQAPAGIRPDLHFLDGDTIREYPPKPPGASDFDFAAQEWRQAAQAALALLDAEAWSELRRERDRRLAACDWTQVEDAPVDRQAWAAYRQALRDLPLNTGDPWQPRWPDAPA